MDPVRQGFRPTLVIDAGIRPEFIVSFIVVACMLGVHLLVVVVYPTKREVKVDDCALWWFLCLQTSQQKLYDDMAAQQSRHHSGLGFSDSGTPAPAPAPVAGGSSDLMDAIAKARAIAEKLTGTTSGGAKRRWNDASVSLTCD
jgi:hypothetical protein